jgi:phospholipase C
MGGRILRVVDSGNGKRTDLIDRQDFLDIEQYDEFSIDFTHAIDEIAADPAANGRRLQETMARRLLTCLPVRFGLRWPAATSVRPYVWFFVAGADAVRWCCQNQPAGPEGPVKIRRRRSAGMSTQGDGLESGPLSPRLLTAEKTGLKGKGLYAMSDEPKGSIAVTPEIAAPIKHVFVLMLENRSFDHLFALSGIAGINAATAADRNTFGSKTYCFQGGAPDPMPSDPGHEFEDVLEQLCGDAKSQYAPGGPYPHTDQSGFVENYATTTTEGGPPPNGDEGAVMLGVNTAAQIPALYLLATNYVLCDGWRSSLPGPTWPNRYFVHGASSAGLDDSPTSTDTALWESLQGFRYPNGSIFDALGPGNYMIYQDESGPLLGRIPQVASLKGISFADVGNLGHFADDLEDNYDYKYTFIEPSYGDVVHDTFEGGSSQHPMDGLKGADQLIARVYSAIRNSPVWPNSLLVILYDEHGGFFDSAPTQSAVPPNDIANSKLNKHGFDFSVLGVRVPAVVVSPWVKKAVVDHTTYDHSSVLATIEILFGLKPLTERDKAANNLLHLLTSSPRSEADCPSGIAS